MPIWSNVFGPSSILLPYLPSVDAESALYAAVEQHLFILGFFIGLSLLPAPFLLLRSANLVWRSIILMLAAWALANSLVLAWVVIHSRQPLPKEENFLARHLEQVFAWNLLLDLLYAVLALLMHYRAAYLPGPVQRWKGFAWAILLNAAVLFLIDLRFLLLLYRA